MTYPRQTMSSSRIEPIVRRVRVLEPYRRLIHVFIYHTSHSSFYPSCFHYLSPFSLTSKKTYLPLQKRFASSRTVCRRTQNSLRYWQSHLPNEQVLRVGRGLQECNKKTRIWKSTSPPSYTDAHLETWQI